MSNDSPCSVVVCDGCCCGSKKKHPEINHKALIDALRTHVSADTKVKVVGCIDECKKSNVVVVRPSKAARKAGAKNIWLGRVLTTDTMHQIARWVMAGGPGVADRPKTLDRHYFKKTKGTKKP